MNKTCSKTKKWISFLLDYYSSSGILTSEGVSVMEQCGRNCSVQMGTGEAARKIRDRFQEKVTVDDLLQTYKEEVFKESNLYRVNQDIILEFLHEECDCEMVKELKIENPLICSCTAGHVKNVFSNLLGQNVNVELLQTILRGDKICKIKITY